MRRALLLLALAALAGACDSLESPTLAAPEQAAPPGKPSRWIADGRSWGASGFYWELWSSPQTTYTGTFDGGLSPVVEVCRVNADDECGTLVAWFSRTGGSTTRRVTVNATEQRYETEWATPSSAAGQVYRVSVRVGTRSLGHADVQMVTSLGQFWTVDYGLYVPWVSGATLPIAFRIETGIPGSITLSSSSLNVGVGDAVTLTATVRDLRGNAMPSIAAEWWVGNTSAAAGPVVSVDSGWVIGANAGTGRVMAWLDNIEAEIPVTVTDTRRAWTAAATPDAQGIDALWGSGSTPTFAAGHAGMLRHNGASWQYVDAVRWRGMNDVLGFSATNVWAAGDDGTLLRFDGTTWTALRYNGTSVQPLALNDWSVPARRVNLRGMWAASATSMLVVGDSGTLLRYNGTAWTAVPTGVTADLTGVWGANATTVFITTADGRVLRYNGSTVTVASGLQAPGALTAVWGTSATNVYAVGERGALYRFNGTSWARTRIPTRNALYDVWGSSTTNVFAAGEGGVVYRWDGTKWLPEKSVGTAQILGLWGSGSTSVHGAGGGGLIIQR